MQAHIFYDGRVQGVGFRYTVCRYASELGLVGWVKNLHDGRVEILAEGNQGKIEELIKKTEEYFSGYIKDKTVDYEAPTGKFSEFRIAF